MIKAGIPILISREDLLTYIPEEDIAFRYVTGFHKIGDFFKSEFRNEKNASSKVFVGERGNLMFKDWGDPNIPKAITLIQYVQYKYNLEYQSAVNKIAIDFGIVDGRSGDLSIVNVGKGKVKKRVYTPSSDLIIKIKKRDWTERDIYYWNQYYIPIEMLERNNIKSISHVFMGNKPPIEFTKDHLVYSYDYYWHRNIFRRKTYAPESKKDKWYSNCDYSIVQGYNVLPKEGGKLLFITSSLKDKLVLNLLGYHSIAPNSESSWLPLEYWNKLIDRWERIILYFDNDIAGINYSKMFSKQYNIPYVYNPLEEPKDISDFVKKYNLETGRDLIRGLKLNYEK